MLTYDENGICTSCGLPGSGFIADGVCHCGDFLDGDYESPGPWLEPEAPISCPNCQMWILDADEEKAGIHNACKDEYRDTHLGGSK